MEEILKNLKAAAEFETNGLADIAKKTSPSPPKPNHSSNRPVDHLA